MNTLSAKQKKVILWLACSAIFFEAFDTSIVNLALTSIASDLRISLPNAQWVQTIFVIMFGSFLLLGGRLCDAFGSKHIFLVGMFMFGLSSALAFVSHTLALLLVLRAGQGMATALAIPAGISLLTKYFKEGDERNYALGIFGSFAAIGFAGGLAMGGIITVHFNWHWIFSINVPIMVIVLAIGYVHIPIDKTGRQTDLNSYSILWLVGSLLLLCFSIHELPRLQWTGILLIAIAATSFQGMIQYDNKQPLPFFDKSLYRQKGIRRAQVVSLLFGGCFLSYIFIGTLALMHIFLLDQKTVGFLLFPYSIVSALISKYILPILFKKTGVVATAKVALTFMLFGVALLIMAISFNILWLALLSLLCINGVSISVGYPALTIMALSGIDTKDQGTAAGLQSSIYSIGSSIGLSVIAFCLQVTHDTIANFPLLLSCSCICFLSLSAWMLLDARATKAIES